MSEISLVVTQPVLKQVAQAGLKERQIALRKPSPNLKEVLRTVRKDKRTRIRLGHAVALELGDSGAIWAVHNAEAADDFNSLYGLLARRPGNEMRFLCSIDQ